MVDTVTVAIDAMGGDHAPGAIVEGAVRAAAELGVQVLLVGPSETLAPLVPDGTVGVELVEAAQVIGMDDAPSAVRSKKDASIVRCAELVRDERADAMISAGNTGATMAAALLRMGRISGVARPAVAVPLPVPGHGEQLLVDGGATVDCSPEWLVQFAVMGRAYARHRLGIEAPRIGLLSNGEEPGKGDALRKRASELLAAVPGFVGNVEGRDLLHPTVDVIVTDGFTGNVALKSLEGAIKATAALVLRVLEQPELSEAAAQVLPPLLLAATELDPDHTGGAALLGVDGVCLVSHGSSSAEAIVSAVRQAARCVDVKLVQQIREAVADAR